MVFDSLKEELLFPGGSFGINVAVVMRLAQKLRPGHTIVTGLHDGGQSNQSELFNSEFLREKDPPAPDRLKTSRSQTTGNGFPASQTRPAETVLRRRRAARVVAKYSTP